jgi:hypothetical protein
MRCQRAISELAPRPARNAQNTYFEKVKNASPQAEIRALAPATLVHHCSLVSAASNQINRNSDEHARGAGQLEFLIYHGVMEMLT